MCWRLMLGAAFLAGTASARAAQAPPAAVAEVREREQQLGEAVRTKDRPQLERLLASDYVLRGSPDVERETWIHNAVTLCWGPRWDIDAFRARQHGDVVVASFELTFYVDPGTCQPAVLRSLITDVWTREATEWRLQIRHSAPPPAVAGIAAQYGTAPVRPPDWELSGELSLLATGGNTSTRSAGFGGSVIHRAERSSTQASVAFITSEVESVTQARSLTMQTRQGLSVRERYELFGRGSYTRDRFAGIDHRATVDAGIGRTLALPHRQSVTAEGAIGFTAESRLDATLLQFATFAGGMRYAWAPVPGTELTEAVALVADLEAAENWRGASITTVSVALTRLLSVKASHALDYRHRPVAGFGRTDMRTAVALVLSWQGRSVPQ